MKTISKFLFLLLLLFSLAGCGSFFGGDEAVGIASIETEELEDGSIKLIINYTDESLKPLEVVLPKGEEGARGNGIKDIDTENGEEVTKIIVTYTDTSKQSDEFTIPHGAEIESILVVDKDGFEIKTDDDGNNYRVDEEGNSLEEEGKYFKGTRFLKVTYTEIDPETKEKRSSIFELPEGKKGQDGNGIESVEAGKLLEDGTIEKDKLNNDGSISIKFKYTLSENSQIITIPANKAITNIEKMPDFGNQYIIKITYNTLKEDGTNETQEIKFDKPVITQWLSGEGEPLDFRGNVGDFYYDEIGLDIWKKYSVVGSNDPNEGYWDKIVDLGEQTHSCYVKFDANGGLFNFGEQQESNDIPQTYKVTAGTYFYGSSNTFPSVYHPEGLKFLGWYTTETITPTSTKFTDLTIVTTDITLYAVWETK